MAEVFKARDAADVLSFVQWAVAEETAIEVRGAGSKLNYGHPMAVDHVLDLSGLRGITLYEPDELVLSARAGTPLREIEALLTENNQQLAFEPADYGDLLASSEGPTIGGVLATNMSGPRRLKAGAARDHFLGVHAVTGRGEAIKSGGRVVKNVTGYDLCKLMAGSFGTLTAMTDVTVKVLPSAVRSRSVLVIGLDAQQATDMMSRAMGGPHEVSAAAYLPAAAASRSSVSYVQSAGASITALRVEGTPISADYRCQSLLGECAEFGAVEELHTANTIRLWQEIRDVADLLPLRDREIWRISVAPNAGASFIDGLAGDGLLDWGGGLVWLSLDSDTDPKQLRRLVAGDGHATLIRATVKRRASVDVFHPPAAGVAALSARVKDSFDPKNLLNPSRMYRDIQGS